MTTPIEHAIEQLGDPPAAFSLVTLSELQRGSPLAVPYITLAVVEYRPLFPLDGGGFSGGDVDISIALHAGSVESVESQYVLDAWTKDFLEWVEAVPWGAREGAQVVPGDDLTLEYGVTMTWAG